jgi:hypothetical protein
MKLRRRRDSSPQEIRPAIAESPVTPEAQAVLETAMLHVSFAGMRLIAGGSSVPDSPKSQAACLLYNCMSVLGLTWGLGGFCRWLGGPIWLCLSGAGAGLAISAALVVASLCRKRMS